MNIIKTRKIWYVISGTLFIGSILVWIALGLKFGLDFTGGTLMEVRYENIERPAQSEVVAKLSDLDLSPAVASTDDNGYILRFKNVSEETHQEIVSRLQPVTAEADAAPADTTDGEALTSPEEAAEAEPTLIEERFESVGASIGDELKRKSIYAVVIILIAIMLFVAYAFRKASYPVSSWKYGVATLIALFHDVIITIGVFIVLGYFYGIEINTPFIAALLTILGYSVNDTIVVFDRIRENLHRLEGDFESIVETSVKQTLGRSINTSLTTLLALSAVLAFGGGSIRDFVLTLIVGIVIGTYSSIFIAAPVLVTWQQLEWKFKKGLK